MNRTSFIPVSLIFFLIACSLTAQEQGPERWEKDIQAFEQWDQEHQPEAGAILFTGSSSIRIWKDIQENFPEHRILNRGFGGSKFSDLIYHADRLIYAYQPSKVFVYEGDNDISSGLTPKEVLKQAKKLRKDIAKNLGPDVPVIFISPKPSVARWNLKDQYEAANALLKQYADKKKHTEFADVWTPSLDASGKVFDHIFLEDNLHMNAEGYKIWRKVLLPYVEGEF